ncbi:MAG: 2Fe-2S iron-sulfur cluster-binding protein [Polyangiaceae bacterium]
MPTFKLDGKEIPFTPGESIIHAAWREGVEIPHYCWHPGLSSPANCRMCLVEIKPPEGQRGVRLDIVEWDAATKSYKNVQKPKLLPSCQMQAVENQEVLSDSSPHVREARKYVQEALLLNHPVDCPICDQAGECKLQDYWLEHQQTKKRMRDEPIHKVKGVSFGDTIVYDGERCVMCTRCIRFMDEVAKDPVLEMRERGNLNEVFVAPGRKLEGNYTFMVEHVCPVGALTTKDFRFKARVWFLRSAKSVCQGCATGCNAHLDYDPRNNKAYRYRPRDNDAVNKFWMCDPGMLSYKAANEGRIVEARLSGKMTSVDKAIGAAKAILTEASFANVAIVLSAQHSLEDNWALLELGTTLGGATQLYWAGAPEGFSDDILIHKDKNSNTLGVTTLAPKAQPISALMTAIAQGQVKAVLALGGASQVELDPSIPIITVAAHDGPITTAAKVVLPAASWAEGPGTYVNSKGLAQTAEKALHLEGASKPAWQWFAELGQALGLDASWTKLKEIRAKLVPAARSAKAATPETVSASS